MIGLKHNRYIDEEAKNEDSSSSDQIIEPSGDDNYDLNDSFIDDSPDHQDKKSDKSVSSEYHYASLLLREDLEYLSSKSFIYLFKYFNNKNGYNLIKKDFNEFECANYFEETHTFYNYNSNYWVKLFQYLKNLFSIESPIYFNWNDLDYAVVEEDISTYIFGILNNLFRGDIIYYIAVLVLDIDIYREFIPNLVVKVINKFEFKVTLNNLYVLVIKNPGQNQIEFIKISLDNYFKNVYDFYLDYKNVSTQFSQISKDVEKAHMENRMVFSDGVNEQLKLYCGCFTLSHDLFKEDNYKHIKEDYQVFNYDQKFNCKSYGFVIYMSKEKYSDKVEENKDIHMPHFLQVIVKGVLFYLCSFISKKHVKRIIAAHEHGTKKFKCHCQGFIEFQDRINCIIRPGKFYIKDFCYLIMFQSAKNKFALENYVKKKDELVPVNKFVELIFDNKTVEELFKDFGNNCVENSVQKFNIYDMILNTPNLSYDLLKEMALDTSDDRAKQFIISNADKIIKFNTNLVSKTYADFKWRFPEYINKFMEEYSKKTLYKSIEEFQRYRFFTFFKSWFESFCVNNDPADLSPKSRKKGLFIYGDRGIGKTYLCKSLCVDINEDDNDNPYLVYCRGTLAWERFKNKKNTAQLIILDDVQFLKKQKEIFKALIVGQPTNFKSNYVDNEYWNRSCPCIVLTNNFHILFNVISSKEYNEDLNIISINYYIGPPNTKPVREVNINLDEETKELIEKEKEKEKKKKDFKFNNKQYIDYYI